MLATLRSKGLRIFNSMKDKNNSPSFQILNSSLNSKNKIYLITSEITMIIIIIIIIIIITTIIIIIIIIVIVIIKTNQHFYSTARVFGAAVRLWETVKSR